jgi:uncharacterized protein YggE
MTSRKTLFAAGAVFLIIVAMLGSALLIKSTPVYINNIGNTDKDGKLLNAIQISGEGKVFAKPDMAELRVNISEEASTTQEALEKVNKKMDQVRDVLKQNKIAENDIQTSNLTMSPKYDYTNYRKLVGQTAGQGVYIKVKQIDSQATKAGKIVDELAKINNIEVNSIQFSLEDREGAVAKARDLAFQDAKKRGEDLAKIAGLKILKAISIQDSNSSSQPPVVYSDSASGSKEVSAARPTQISTGQLEITVRLDVAFGVE